MRKGVLKINGELITGKWVAPSTASRINGLSAHWNKCMDNFSITNHPEYRLLTFCGNDLEKVCFTDGSSDSYPDGFDIVHGSQLIDQGIAKVEQPHIIPA